MKLYKDLFVEYVKDHRNEFTYHEDYGDTGIKYVFMLPSPHKLFGIFPIKFKFITYDNPEDFENGIRYNRYIIDIKTIFWNGIRLEYDKDREFIELLSDIFQETYKRTIRERRTNKFIKLFNLTKEK